MTELEPTRATRCRWGAALVVGALAAGPAVAGDGLLYYVDDGRVVITNVASRPDVRPVPGFQERVAEAMAGDLPATPFDRTIEVVAARYGLPSALIKAVAMVESAFDPDAVSSKGAMGLMQLMPATARHYGVDDPFDPDQSLDAGARMLRELLDEFGGDLTLALAAYNAGPGAVRRWGGVPEYRETRDYVRKVRSRMSPDGRDPDPGRSDPPGATDIRMRTLEDGSVLLSN